MLTTINPVVQKGISILFYDPSSPPLLLLLLSAPLFTHYVLEHIVLNIGSV